MNNNPENHQQRPAVPKRSTERSRRLPPIEDNNWQPYWTPEKLINWIPSNVEQTQTLPQLEINIPGNLNSSSNPLINPSSHTSGSNNMGFSQGLVMLPERETVSSSPRHSSRGSQHPSGLNTAGFPYPELTANILMPSSIPMPNQHPSGSNVVPPAYVSQDHYRSMPNSTRGSSRPGQYPSGSSIGPPGGSDNVSMPSSMMGPSSRNINQPNIPNIALAPFKFPDNIPVIPSSTGHPPMPPPRRNPPSSRSNTRFQRPELANNAPMPFSTGHPSSQYQNSFNMFKTRADLQFLDSISTSRPYLPRNHPWRNPHPSQIEQLGEPIHTKEILLKNSPQKESRMMSTTSSNAPQPLQSTANENMIKQYNAKRIEQLHQPFYSEYRPRRGTSNNTGYLAYTAPAGTAKTGSSIPGNGNAIPDTNLQTNAQITTGQCGQNPFTSSHPYQSHSNSYKKNNPQNSQFNNPGRERSPISAFSDNPQTSAHNPLPPPQDPIICPPGTSRNISISRPRARDTREKSSDPSSSSDPRNPALIPPPASKNSIISSDGFKIPKQRNPKASPSQGQNPLRRSDPSSSSISSETKDQSRNSRRKSLEPKKLTDFTKDTDDSEDSDLIDWVEERN